MNPDFKIFWFKHSLFLKKMDPARLRCGISTILRNILLQHAHRAQLIVHIKLQVTRASHASINS